MIVRTAVAFSIVLVAVAGIATLLGYLDRYSWLFEVLAFLRVQYLVALAAAAALALATGRLWLAALAAALMALDVIAIAPQFIAPKQERPGSGRITMLLFNVQVGNTDYEAARRVIRQQNPDVLGITELSRPWLDALGADLSVYNDRIVAPQNDAYGIGIFSRLPVRSMRIAHLPRDGPPTAIARLTVGDRLLTVVVTHPHTPFGPHAGGLHRRQFSALTEALPELGTPLAICGDFNTPPWGYLVRRLARAGHLVDSHRGFGFDSSWPAWSWFLRVPIDDCLVSRDFVVVDRRTIRHTGSDHFALRVVLAPAARGH